MRPKYICLAPGVSPKREAKNLEKSVKMVADFSSAITSLQFSSIHSLTYRMPFLSMTKIIFWKTNTSTE